MFIDTHTHIYAEEFDADRAKTLQRALDAGADKLLLPNIDAASIDPMLAMCRDYPRHCFPMIGLHPTELPENPQPLLDEMEARLQTPGHPFVAIGEVGIDLYWDDSRREEQIEVLRRQTEWAQRYSLPLVIHSRSAHRELVDTLRPYANQTSGVFHCFGGSMEEAQELLSLFPDFVLGIGGVLTFKKSQLPAVLHAAVPLNRIVVETDAPYLAPTPHRGKRNEPAYIPLIIAKIADIYGLSMEKTEQILMENTYRIFKKLPSQ